MSRGDIIRSILRAAADGRVYEARHLHQAAYRSTRDMRLRRQLEVISRVLYDPAPQIAAVLVLEALERRQQGRR